MHEYDLIADWYVGDRGTGGLPEALKMAAALPSGARILDIGCGNGVPITRAFIHAGHRVVGLDTSREMLTRFRVNLPGVAAVRGRIQDATFAPDSFDAAHAWGVIFHLPVQDQIAAIRSVSQLLKPTAPFLFTAGDVDGPEPHEDTMNGVVFRYYSLTVQGYRDVLAQHGLTLVSHTIDRGENGYYLARKSADGRAG